MYALNDLFCMLFYKEAICFLKLQMPFVCNASEKYKSPDTILGQSSLISMGKDNDQHL